MNASLAQLGRRVTVKQHQIQERHAKGRLRPAAVKRQLEHPGVDDVAVELEGHPAELDRAKPDRFAQQDRFRFPRHLNRWVAQKPLNDHVVFQLVADAAGGQHIFDLLQQSLTGTGHGGELLFGMNENVQCEQNNGIFIAKLAIYFYRRHFCNGRAHRRALRHLDENWARHHVQHVDAGEGSGHELAHLFAGGAGRSDGAALSRGRWADWVAPQGVQRWR
ncbi:MAG: hypothetical protein CL678_16680 [Bdellovibrionaceae bacterium]|nr:hypothetical protein [Pseudobdellovibrionaceae bacterium]